MKLVFEIICPQSSILVIPLSLTQLFLFPSHLHRKGLRRFNYEFLFSISSASENYGLKLKVHHKIAFERFSWGLAAAHAQNVNCHSTATCGAASLPAAAPHATCLTRTTLVPLPNHCVIECSRITLDIGWSSLARCTGQSPLGIYNPYFSRRFILADLSHCALILPILDLTCSRTTSGRSRWEHFAADALLVSISQLIAHCAGEAASFADPGYCTACQCKPTSRVDSLSTN